MTRDHTPSKLRFSEDELDNPELKKLADKAEKAADKYEKTKKRLPQKHRLKLTIEGTVVEENTNGIPESTERDMPLTDPSAPSVMNTRKKKTQIQSSGTPSMEKIPSQDRTAKVNAPNAIPQTPKNKTVRLRFEETTKKPASRMMHPVQKTIRSAGDQFHRQVCDSNADDNVGVNAALTADNTMKTSLQMGEHAYHSHKLRAYRNLDRAEKKWDKANVRYLQKKQETANPQFTSNPVSRWQQKHAIRKEYAKAKRGKSTAYQAESTVKDAEKATETAVDVIKKAGQKLKSSPREVLICGLIGMLLIIMSAIQSCTPLAQSVLESVVIGTYPAEEEDVRAAERAYVAKEKELQDEMKNYEKYHPGCDEYHVDADEIWHDPYVLIAIISAYYDGQDWDIDSAYPVIEKYFNLQYIVTEDIVTETRYHSATDYQYDEETGEYISVSVSVPYEYKICNVKMENKDLSHLPVVSMSRHGLGMYALYMATHGNMEGIFRGGHAVPLREPGKYDIPQEVLDSDPTFAKLIEEAEQYIGYPYVWGGDSPETSYDCSGFVSYVFTNSGVYNCGRLGAKGLYSACRKVDEPKPGDIVFFEGTMGDDVAGITHCGIYVGNNMMLHCGSPIGYVSLNDSYYKKHFHSFGRFPGL